MVFFEKTNTMNDAICFFVPKKYPTLELEHIKKLQTAFPDLTDKEIIKIQNEVVYWNDPPFAKQWTGCIIRGTLQTYSHSDPAFSFPYDSDEERFKEEYPNGIVFE